MEFADADADAVQMLRRHAKPFETALRFYESPVECAEKGLGTAKGFDKHFGCPTCAPEAMGGPCCAGAIGDPDVRTTFPGSTTATPGLQTTHEAPPFATARWNEMSRLVPAMLWPPNAVVRRFRLAFAIFRGDLPMP